MLAFIITFFRDYFGNEFPPSPSRFFQALTAGLSDRRDLAAKERALEWIERLPAPEIFIQSASNYRHNLSSLKGIFQPDNDNNSPIAIVDGVIGHKRSEPQSLSRYTFTEGTRIVYHYPTAGECPEPKALAALVKSIGYLGRSEDLVMVTVIVNGPIETAGLRRLLPGKNGPVSLLVPRRGFLADLKRRWPRQVSAYPARRGVQKTVSYSFNPEDTDPVPVAFFEALRKNRESQDYLDFAPFQLRQLSGLVRGAMIREALRLGLNNPDVERLVCGHHETRQRVAYADGEQHFAVVPIPSMDEGWNADGRLRHIAIIGYGISSDADRELFDTLSSKLHEAPLLDNGRAVGTLHLKEAKYLGYMGTFFRGKSRRWQSITPVVLTQYDNRPGRPTARCLGFSDAELETVETVTAFRGPLLPTSEHPNDYQVADYLARWPRVHLDIRFKAERAGPMLIGRGRYVGLGLMVPIY
jgi:CRISPR-associated protein Csb2